MRVLLIGEYSGLHNALRSGLLTLGHEAVLAADTDGWKNFPSDIALGSQRGLLVDFAARLIKPEFLLPPFESFDVVQLINPFPFTSFVIPTRFVLARRLKRANNLYLLAAGDDAFYFSEVDKHLRYSPVQDVLNYDKTSSWRRNYWYRKDVVQWCKYVHDTVAAVIPTCHEYAVCYSWSPKCAAAIPFPVDASSIEYAPVRPGKRKLRVFHGLNRPGVRGTRYILEAFEMAKKKYPNDLEIIVAGRMPITEYRKFLKSVDVVVDQTWGYSPGMNALHALASGKIVLSGSEPEHLSAWRIESSPVINITPNPQKIVQGLEWVLGQRADLEEMSERSRHYVETVHDAPVVARQYIDAWSGAER